MDPRRPRDPASPVTPQTVIDQARTYLGVPYRHQGRSRLGLDCVGLVIAVASDLQLLPTEFIANNYGRLPKDELVEKTGTFCLPVQGPEAGGLVLLRWPNEKRPGHSAILTEDAAQIIHSYSTAGAVVEHGYRAHWPTWAVSFWRLPNVNYG
jgi:cell wall-associated NlpC family hydrolase